MRPIIFFTHDSLYSARVLSRLLNEPSVNVVGIVLSTCVMRRGRHAFFDSLRLIRYSGLRYACYQALVTQLYSLLPMQWGKPSLARLARQAGLPIYKTNDVNAGEVLSTLKGLDVTMGVSCYFNQLFQADIYSALPLGILNVHPSLLPNNRGVDPLFYARLRDEPVGGVTIHRIDEALDTGTILMAKEFDLDHEQSFIRQQMALFDLGAELLIKLLRQFDVYSVGQRQDAGGNYDSWPSGAQVRQVKHLLKV